MTDKIKNYLFAASVLLYVALFLKLSTFDLAFSQHLTSHRSEPFVVWGTYIAVIPASLIAGFCCCVLARTYTGRNMYFFETAGCVLSAVVGYHLCGVFTEKQFLFCIPAGALIYPLLRFSAGRIVINEQSVRICRAGILLAACSVSLTSLLKVIWGRPRFWSLYLEEQDFAKWYMISGPAWFEDMNKSFPSGHTTAASNILWIRYLPYLNGRFAGKNVPLTVFALLWIICTALSRIMAGMHYITDTMGGFAVCLAVYLIIDRKLVRQSLLK